jgi:hypothetical protein
MAVETNRGAMRHAVRVFVMDVGRGFAEEK